MTLLLWSVSELGLMMGLLLGLISKSEVRFGLGSGVGLWNGGFSGQVFQIF